MLQRWKDKLDEKRDQGLRMAGGGALAAGGGAALTSVEYVDLDYTPWSTSKKLLVVVLCLLMFGPFGPLIAWRRERRRRIWNIIVFHALFVLGLAILAAFTQ